MDILEVDKNLNVLTKELIKREYQDTDQSSQGTRKVKQYYFNILKLI